MHMRGPVVFGGAILSRAFECPGYRFILRALFFLKEQAALPVKKRSLFCGLCQQPYCSTGNGTRLHQLNQALLKQSLSMKGFFNLYCEAVFCVTGQQYAFASVQPGTSGN